MYIISDAQWAHESNGPFRSLRTRVIDVSFELLCQWFNCPRDPPPTSPPAPLASGQDAADPGLSSPVPIPVYRDFIYNAAYRTRTPLAALVLAVYFVRKLHDRHPLVAGTHVTPHRVMLAAILLACKILYDDTYSNRTWVHVSQRLFGLEEVNRMEWEMLTYLDFGLVATRDEWIEHCEALDRMIEHHCQAGGVAMVPTSVVAELNSLFHYPDTSNRPLTPFQPPAPPARPNQQQQQHQNPLYAADDAVAAASSSTSASAGMASAMDVDSMHAVPTGKHAASSSSAAAAADSVNTPYPASQAGGSGSYHPGRPNSRSSYSHPAKMQQHQHLHRSRDSLPRPPPTATTAATDRASAASIAAAALVGMAATGRSGTSGGAWAQHSQAANWRMGRQEPGAAEQYHHHQLQQQQQQQQHKLQRQYSRADMAEATYPPPQRSSSSLSSSSPTSNAAPAALYPSTWSTSDSRGPTAPPHPLNHNGGYTHLPPPPPSLAANDMMNGTASAVKSRSAFPPPAAYRPAAPYPPATAAGYPHASSTSVGAATGPTVPFPRMPTAAAPAFANGNGGIVTNGLSSSAPTSSRATMDEREAMLHNGKRRDSGSDLVAMTGSTQQQQQQQQNGSHGISGTLGG